MFVAACLREAPYACGQMIFVPDNAARNFPILASMTLRRAVVQAIFSQRLEWVPVPESPVSVAAWSTHAGWFVANMLTVRLSSKKLMSKSSAGARYG